MAIALQGLYNQSHQFSAGIVNINAPFVGNVLAIEVTTKPEYLPNTQVVGYLYQHYGSASKGYALRSGKDIISLELPESDSLSFVPTPYLSDTYTLSIKYATIGAVIDGENTAGLPQQILDLPNNVQAIDLHLVNIENAISELEQAIPTWETLTGKPLAFPPSSHNHVKAEITDLSLAWADITEKPLTFPPNSHTHTPDQIVGLSGLGGSSYIALSSNQTLESNKKYLATVNNLVCSLPANPAIGDWVELTNGNFSSFRINHGNNSQSILNNQTQSTAGSTDSGIILKPYGFISLTFVGSNLWISSNKHRTVNNWLSLSIVEPVETQKSYTPTPFASYLYNSSYNFSFINDGNTGVGVSATSLNASQGLSMIATFATTTIITSFQSFNGQWNGAFNFPNRLRIYRGNTIDNSNLVYDGNPINGSQITISPEPTQASLQWVFQFTNGTGDVSVNEFRIWGRGASIGEISVI
jgi:hypothetical protein